MISRNEARECVAAGAEYLDRIKPDWYEAIDVGTLTISSDCHCVLAQTYGRKYSSAVLAAGFRWNDRADDVAGYYSQSGSVINLGFFAPENDRDDSKLLQDAWIEAIADRCLRSESAQAADAVDPVAPNQHELTTRV